MAIENGYVNEDIKKDNKGAKRAVYTIAIC